MGFFRRLGLGLSTSVFSSLVVVFALALCTYFVLDNSNEVKQALSKSGVYQVLVDSTLTQKKEQLGRYLPINNPEVQKVVRDSFSTSYLQNTTERNIDATYTWLHGLTQKPNYSADLSQPKSALADNLGMLVAQHLNGLPACTKTVALPTSVDDILSLTCRPIGVSSDFLVAATQLQVSQSNVFDRVVAPVLTFQDEQGKSLTDKMSYVPKAHHYFVMALYVIPAILLITGLAIIFWSETKRTGLRRLARILIVTGIISILLSLTVVWGLGKAARYMADSNADLLLLQGKVVEIAHILGEHFRNWLMGIGSGYALVGVILLVGGRLSGRSSMKQNKALNKSLGYSENIPTAGTRFDPTAADGSKELTNRERSTDTAPELKKSPDSGDKSNGISN
jgi:hypothetical protein